MKPNTIETTTNGTPLNGLTRYYVHTNEGRKVTWAKDEIAARERAERQYLSVSRIEVAPPLGE